MEFKVGDRVVITGYKDSRLNSDDVGKVSTIKKLFIHPILNKPAADIVRVQMSDLYPPTETCTNYVYLHELRHLTKLERALA